VRGNTEDINHETWREKRFALDGSLF